MVADPAIIDSVRSEYLEMPGLSLTLAQAARLWQLEESDCEAALTYLVVTGFLKRDGEQYRRAGRSV